MKKATLTLLLFWSLSSTPSAGSLARPSAPITSLRGGIATLYAHDAGTQSFCFRDGCPGKVIQDNQIKNRCSDLVFNVYGAGTLAVGTEGGQQGAIVDLGTAPELARRYSIKDGKSKVQGYASLHLAGDLLIGSEQAGDRPRRVAEAAPLFRELGQVVTVPVIQNHLYVARLRSAEYDFLVKILVLSYRPDESVTIRWHLLNDVAAPPIRGDCL